MTLATALRRSPIGGNLPTFVASEWADTAGATASSITIPKPAGTTTGDLMIAVTASVTGIDFTGDTGWTQVSDTLSGDMFMRIAWKVATASEPSSYSFTVFGPKVVCGGYIQTWRNAAFDVAGTFFNGSPGTNPVVMPEVTPTGSAMLLGFVGGSVLGIGYTTPTGMTLREADNTYAPSVASFYEAVVPGATGTRTSTPDTSAGHRGALIAIRKA